MILLFDHFVRRSVEEGCFMLGSGLGKKVDAQFVKNEYQTYLNQNNKLQVPKKPLTKEEKREEARKKGIFVVADDPDFEPTVFEKGTTASRPAIDHSKARPLRWKKSKTNRKHSQSPASDSDNNDVTVAVRRKPKKDHKKEEKETDKSLKAKTSIGAMAEKRQTRKSTVSTDASRSSQKKPKAKVTKSATKVDDTENSIDESQKKIKADQSAREVSSAMPASERDDDSSAVRVKKVKEEDSGRQLTPAKQPVDPEDTNTAALTPVTKSAADVPKNAETSTHNEESQKQSAAKTSESRDSDHSLTTLVEPVMSTKLAPKAKDTVFGKLEDEEFEKIMQQECAANDKAAIKAARKILRVAHREKAFEKLMTKEENELLARFFSGKVAYTKEVLKVLDVALDKTIDWMKVNNISIDEETKKLIEEREKVKAALFEEIMTSPKYIPETWTKKYKELLAESTREKVGINWARILLCYPSQKSFGDGPEDAFGNFTRQKRGYILGCVLGPSDSKSFQETKREEACRGLYMDTAFISNARDSDEISAVSTVKTPDNSTSPAGTTNHISAAEPKKEK